MSATRFLTGITTTGTPHLGNYVGSIRPSVRASLRTDVESFYFLADYHALIKVEDPARIQRSTLEIAASWLAAGLDPARVTFYRQSDIPEIPELTWLLACVAPKGLLNRAHGIQPKATRSALSSPRITSTFDGFKSRWMIPFVCACWTASHT
jgi:tryptophanyl-tRNA synthetase